MLKATNKLWQAAALTPDLLRASLPKQWFLKLARPHIGLAVSGGVDSMALAALCSKLHWSAGASGISFTAFIVDHGLRPGSDDEARVVAKHLEQLKMPSKIITLDSAQYGDARATRKVESVARRLRYRALGSECRSRGITNLLFAHHADDQAETTLMRLANNYLGKGLAGMQREARIPECEDLYGVHSSGTPRVLHSKHAMSNQGYYTRRALFESGGITIIRPLLDHTKDRLIATCEESDVQWVEDHTNKDRSLTLRNTVRYLHEADLLPTALRRPSLCALAARTSEWAIRLESRVDAIFQSFDHAFDARSGHAICKVAYDRVDDINAMPDCDHVRAMLLRKLLLLVSPMETVDLSTLEAASSGFLQTHDWQPNTVQSIPIAVAGTTVVKLENSDGSVVYEVRRTLPPRNAKGSRSEIGISLPLQLRHEGAQRELVWSEWKLWDERYWIRIGGHTGSNAPSLEITVRLLTPADISTLRQEVQSTMNDLNNRLAAIKGHLRSTLPAIVQTFDGRDRIVALPSLRWSRNTWFPASKKRENPKTHYYDIRYKHIDDAFTAPMNLEPKSVS